MLKKLKNGKSFTDGIGDNSSSEDTGFMSMSNGNYLKKFKVILAWDSVNYGKIVLGNLIV